MAQEIKNTFLKSKMNKDLDDRILPIGALVGLDILGSS